MEGCYPGLGAGGAVMIGGELDNLKSTSVPGTPNPVIPAEAGIQSKPPTKKPSANSKPQPSVTAC
jgi:hypothetical protein